jgi:hypothetical protein
LERKNEEIEEEELIEVVESKEQWVKRLELMNNVVYPATKEGVSKRQGLLADRLNQYRKLVSFEVGDMVMAKDVTKESKWNPHYVGPFRVVRCNLGGAYKLEDRANRLLPLPFRFPPSHLKYYHFYR